MIKINIIIFVILISTWIQARTITGQEALRQITPETLSIMDLQLKISKSLTSLYSTTFETIPSLQKTLKNMKTEDLDLFIQKQNKDITSIDELVDAVRKLAISEFEPIMEAKTQLFETKMNKMIADYFQYVLSINLDTDKLFLVEMHDKLITEVSSSLSIQIVNFSTNPVLPIDLKDEKYNELVNSLPQRIRRIHIQLSLQKILVKYLLVADWYTKFDGIITRDYTTDITNIIEEIKEDLNLENEEFVKSIIVPAFNQLQSKKLMRDQLNYFDFFNRNAVNLVMAFKNPLKNFLIKEVMTASLTTPGSNLFNEPYANKFCNFLEKHYNSKSFYQIKSKQEVDEERQEMEKSIVEETLEVQIDTRNKFNTENSPRAELTKLKRQQAVEFDMLACYPDLVLQKTFSEEQLTALFRLHANPNNSLFFMKLWKYFKTTKEDGQEFYTSQFDPIYAHFYRHYLENRLSKEDRTYDIQQWILYMDPTYYQTFDQNAEDAQFIFITYLLTKIVYQPNKQYYFGQYPVDDKSNYWFKLFLENDEFVVDYKRTPQAHLPKINVEPKLSLAIPQIGQITQQESSVLSNPNVVSVIHEKLVNGQRIVKMTDLDSTFESDTDVYVVFVDRKSSECNDPNDKLNY